MRDAMKIRMPISVLLLAASSFAQGQAVPAASPAMAPSNSGLNLMPLDGVLHYSMSASEVVQFGYYGPGEVTSSTALSGDVAYTAKSSVRPFSLVLAGGVSLPNQSGQNTSTFWNISAAQGLVTRRWVFNISDSFSFLPQSPTTGLSGIPGVGDLGGIPIQGPVEGPAGGVLSVAGDRLSNSLGGSVERQLSHDTSISGSAGWSILNFLGDDQNGFLNNSSVSGTVALNRRIDARSSVSLDAVYSTFTYSGNTTGVNEPDIETRGINVSYQRLLSKTLSMGISAGPQWVSSSNSLLIPSSLDVAATGSLTYSRGFTNASLNYSRGVNGGSGVLPGAISDNVSVFVGHTYGRNWVLSFNAAYEHSAGLTLLQQTGAPGIPVNEVYDTVFGGVQLTRRISEHLSGYASYEAQHQDSNYSNSSLSGQNALNGTSQTFGIGITFSPRSTRLGQF